MIITQYRQTVKCDTCDKTVVADSVDSPPPGPVPVDWIQTAPPGTTRPREFCSVACMANWEGETVKPWEEIEAPVPAKGAAGG